MAKTPEVKRDPLDLPAIYANQATLSMSQFGWRLTFSESLDGSTKDQQHRVAIYLPVEVGLNLKKLLEQMTQPPNAPQN